MFRRMRKCLVRAGKAPAAARWTGALAAPAAALSLVAAASPPSLAGGAGSRAGLTACYDALTKPELAEIACEYKALLTEQERGDMRRLTRGLLQDASCTIKVRIARTLVEPAIREKDHVFHAPPQEMACEIKTRNGTIPITGTFAPKVTFKADKAVEGTPGLDNVKGVNRYLAWPVVTYVNRSATARDGMLAIVNALRGPLRAELYGEK